MSVSVTTAAATAPIDSVPLDSTVPQPATPPGALDAITAAVAHLDLLGDSSGIPEDWVIRDLDPGVPMDPVLLAESDPFLGLLACADGTVREGVDESWVSRTFSAPGLPLDDGLLSIEILIEVETVADWDADRLALEDCEAHEMAQVEVVDDELEPAESASSTPEPTDDTLAATHVELLSAPTADVPYPSAFDAVTLNADNVTVTVILGGVDMGESWRPIADQIAWDVLGALRSPPPDQ